MSSSAYLTIGKVVKRLAKTYPDLTVSKVRFLEDEGLIAPSRTTSGYRVFTSSDVDRLEYILYLQKQRFLPLSVIKDELDRARDKGYSLPNGFSLLEEETNLADSAPSKVLEDASNQDKPIEASKTTGDSNANNFRPTNLDASSISAHTNSRFDSETLEKLHPIDRMPELLGVTVSFVRQLSNVGIVHLKRSPHGRDLVEGKDFTLIQLAHELQHFSIRPEHLRQYVTAANRESGMFNNALVVYAKKGGGVSVDHTPERNDRFNHALSTMLQLTERIRSELIRRRVAEKYGDMHIVEP